MKYTFYCCFVVIYALFLSLCEGQDNSCLSEFSVEPGSIPAGNLNKTASPEEDSSVVITVFLPETQPRNLLYTFRWSSNLKEDIYIKNSDNNKALERMLFYYDESGKNIDVYLDKAISSFEKQHAKIEKMLFDVTFYFNFDHGMCSLLLRHVVAFNNGKLKDTPESERHSGRAAHHSHYNTKKDFNSFKAYPSMNSAKSYNTLAAEEVLPKEGMLTGAKTPSTTKLKSTAMTGTCPPCPYPEGLKFNQDRYTFQAPTDSQDYIGAIKAVNTVQKRLPENVDDEIIYTWDRDAVAASYFLLNEKQGVITTVNSFTPVGNYWLRALANTSSDSTDTMVNIIITELTDQNLPFVVSALTHSSIREEVFVGDTGVKVVAEGAEFYCIQTVQPEHYADTVVISSTNGSVYINGSVDADDPELGTKIHIRVASFLAEPPFCPQKSIAEDLARNEAMVMLDIIDANDNSPVLYDLGGEQIDSLVSLAYPKDKALQRAKGVLTKVLGRDADGTSVVSYSLAGEDSVNFAINSYTGNVYLIGEKVACMKQTCQFDVEASDGENKVHLKMSVTSLTIDNIYTLTLRDTTPEGVDKILFELSKEANTNILQVYSTVQSLVIGFDESLIEEDVWSLEVHVYALDENGTFLTLEELNGKLTSEGLLATEFTERSEFVKESDGSGSDDDDDLKSYKIAVGVLGLFVGLCLLAVIAVGTAKVKEKESEKDKEKETKKVPPRPPQTMARVNPAFSPEKGVTNPDTTESFASIFVDNYSTISSTGKSKQSLTNSTTFPSVTVEEADSPLTGLRVEAAPVATFISSGGERYFSRDETDVVRKPSSNFDDEEQTSLQTSKAVAEVHGVNPVEEDRSATTDRIPGNMPSDSPDTNKDEFIEIKLCIL